MTSLARATLAAVSAFALAPVALAQQPPPADAPQVSAKAVAEAAAPGEGVRKFDPAYFARFSPVNAYDMVRQLPGFSIENGDSLRGFGATAGNVLIDGRRPASKNAISEELGRISARDVERVELIGASAAGDIDVRGYTELANVVLKPATGVQVSSNYQAAVGVNGNHVGGRLAGTRSWKTDDLAIRLNTQNSLSTGRAETDIDVYDGAGVLTETREEFSQQNLVEIGVNGNLTWTPNARDTIGLTGRVMGRDYARPFGSVRYSPAGAVTRVESDDYVEKDIFYFDLGGDWEHRFSPQNSFKIVTVNSWVNWRPQELFESFTPTGAPRSATLNNSDNSRGEHVLRGVWTWKPTTSHTIETGLEAAYNYRDTVRYISDSAGGGAFVPRVLPIASTKVEEDRGEAFITDTWRINPKLTLETGFNYEFSTIKQSGDASQERDFTYPKPRLVGTWLPTARDQLRLSYERQVAQLDFSEFASVVFLTEGRETIGNPNLEPEQTWHAELQWKRSIGSRGSVTLTGFYDQIDDVQDAIPIRAAPDSAACLLNFNANDCVSTAAGNIGPGERWGGRLDFTLPLDAIGVNGGVLKFYGIVKDTTVADPITGRDRVIADEFTSEWNIDFRQDLPELKLAWGGDYSGAGDADYFRLNEEQNISFGPGDLDLFIETTAVKGVTIRLAADNIGSQPQRTDRRFFSPNRYPGGAFSGREYRDTHNTPIYQLIFTGSF